MKYNTTTSIIPMKTFLELKCGEVFLDKDEIPCVKIPNVKNYYGESPYNYVKLPTGGLDFLEDDKDVIIPEYAFEIQTLKKEVGK